MKQILQQMDKLGSLIKQEGHFQRQAQAAESDFQTEKSRLMAAKCLLENNREQRINELECQIQSIKSQLAVGNTGESGKIAALNAELEALNDCDHISLDRKQLDDEVTETIKALYHAIAAQELYHAWYCEVNREMLTLSNMLSPQSMISVASVVQDTSFITSELEPIVEIITGEPAQCNSKNYSQSWAMQDTAKRIVSQGRSRINQIKKQLTV